EVVIRCVGVGAEARKRGIHDVRPDRPHRFVVEAERRDGRRGIVRDEDVRPLEEPSRHGLALGRLQIETETSLAGQKLGGYHAAVGPCFGTETVFWHPPWAEKSDDV